MKFDKFEIEGNFGISEGNDVGDTTNFYVEYEFV